MRWNYRNFTLTMPTGKMIVWQQRNGQHEVSFFVYWIKYWKWFSNYKSFVVWKTCQVLPATYIPVWEIPGAINWPDKSRGKKDVACLSFQKHLSIFCLQSVSFFSKTLRNLTCNGKLFFSLLWAQCKADLYRVQNFQQQNWFHWIRYFPWKTVSLMAYQRYDRPKDTVAAISEL